MNIIRPETFIDKMVKKEELGQPFALMDHQREVLRLTSILMADCPWDTIIYQLR